MSLPNVYQNKNIKIDKTPQELFYGNNKASIKKTTNKDIKATIKNMFQSRNYVYKLDCLIMTTTKEYDTSIIGYNSHNLITIDNELIPLNDITDIYEKKRN